MATEIITHCDNVKRHEKKLAKVPFVYKIVAMGVEPEKPFAEQGRRLRWLRQAQRIPNQTTFAAQFGWPQSGMSQFETGARQVPANKVLELRSKIPGFDPVWLWTGEKRGLSFDLLQRIEAEEAKENPHQSARTSE